MESNLSFLIKVLLISALISIAIKQLGPTIPITGTTATVLLIVLLPTVVMAMVLGWRAWQQRSPH